MAMIGDENSDNSVSVCTYSQKGMPIQVQAKLTALLLLRTVSEESIAQNRGLWVSLDCPFPTRPGRQAIQSDCLITISIAFGRGGGGWLPQKREDGVLRSE
jgi:hypothetical protein